jgi:hypothetical protein
MANSIGISEAFRVGDLSEFIPEADMPLDRGILRYVAALRSGGIETFESCEGGNGHAFLEPTVRFHGGMGEGFRAYGIARQHGLPVSAVRLYYSSIDGMLHGPWWEMTFSTIDRS